MLSFRMRDSPVCHWMVPVRTSARKIAKGFGKNQFSPLEGLSCIKEKPFVLEPSLNTFLPTYHKRFTFRGRLVSSLKANMF